MITHCSKLTTCGTLEDGETVKLEFVDAGGNPVSLLLSFEDAESISMTLPRLLTQAVKAQTGQDNARYVFALGRWLLEGVEDRQSLILTWAPIDGFEVSFRIPPATSRDQRLTILHPLQEPSTESEHITRIVLPGLRLDGLRQQPRQRH